MNWYGGFLVVSILSEACSLTQWKDKKAVQLVNKADHVYTQGDAATAANLYRRALRFAPKNGKAYLGLAKAEDKNRHPEQVEWAALRAIDQVNYSEQRLQSYILLGDAYLDLHPHESAYVDAIGRMASEVLRFDPASADGHRQWAEIASIKANQNAEYAEHWREKAITEFERADSLRKDDFRTLSGLAATLVSAGRLQQAETVYKRLRVMRPNDLTNELALARLALARNDQNGAAVIIRGIVSHGTADIPALASFCREEIALGWFNDVLPIISYLDQHGTDSAVVSKLYAGSNHPEKAISFLESRIAKAKGRAASSDYVLLGNSFMDAGLPTRAVAVARECLSRDFRALACQAVQYRAISALLTPAR